jgi:hypothetical protein
LPTAETQSGEESIARMLDAVALELNNLFQIMLSAGVHLQETWEKEPVPQEITDIQEAARRGASLTKDLRKLSGPGTREDEAPS